MHISSPSHRFRAGGSVTHHPSGPRIAVDDLGRTPLARVAIAAAVPIALALMLAPPAMASRRTALPRSSQPSSIAASARGEVKDARRSTSHRGAPFRAMRATGRHTRLARTAASGAPAVRFGQLHCYVDSLNALWKTVTADSPEVAATDRTNYTDREVVYFRSRLWENGGADVLNGTGWYPAEGWTGWQSQTVDDAHFGRASHGWQWQLFDGQKTHAVENQIYFSSTGKTIPYWSSDAQGLRVYCGTQGYMRRF